MHGLHLHRTAAGVLALVATAAVGIAQAPLVGANTQLTWPIGLANGVDGHTRPATAYGPADDVFLVVFEQTYTQGAITATTLAGRFVSGTGTPLGTSDCAIHPVHRSVQPRVAYNPDRDEFLVVWEHDDLRTNNPCGPGVPLDESILARRVAYDPSGACGAFRFVGDAFYVTDVPSGGCDTVYDVEPDVAYGAGDYLVAWTDHDTVSTKKMVLGQFVAGVQNGGSGGGQLQGGRRTLFTRPPGVADFQEVALAYNSDDPCFVAVCRYTVAGNPASDVMGQVILPWSLGGTVKYAAYLAIGQTSRAAGRPDLAYGLGQQHFLIGWPDLSLAGGATARTIWAQRAAITTAMFVPIGANFLVSAGVGGSTAGDTRTCSVAYDSSTEDRFAFVFDRFCSPVPCFPAENGDCMLRIVAGAQGGGSGGSETIGERVSLVDAAGTAPAQKRPAVAHGSQRATFLVPWDDDRPLPTVVPPYKIFGQRARSTFETVRLGASQLGSYRSGDNAHLQMFGPATAPLVLHLSASPRIPPLPLPPPFVGSLCLGDPMFVGPGGSTDADGAWDSGSIRIPGTAAPVTLYFQGVLLSGGQVFLSNCIPLRISP